MKWVIEKDCFLENEERFKNAMPTCCFVKYLPFDETKQLETVLGLLPKKQDNNVIFYGSINLGKKLIRQGYSWQIWLPDKVFDCSYWLSRFNKYCFNQDFQIQPFACLYENLKNNNNKIFIRPNSGYKLFSGQTVRQKDRYQTIINLKDQHNLMPEDLVLVSNYGVINAEYRFVIGSDLEENRIISGCRYILENKHDESTEIPDECYDFVKEILEVANKIMYHPAPAWTLDIAYDGSYWLLETGSFSSAGLYSCDISEVVKQINKVAKDLTL